MILPLRKGTHTIPISHLKLVGGETDASAYALAMQLAGRLFDGGVWDGKHPLHIADVHALARRLHPYRINELSLFTLSELLESTQPPAPTQPSVSEQPLAYAVGMQVTWEADACDCDGDPLPFSSGRIVEIERERVWVESPSADDDRWVARATLRPVLSTH